MRNVSVSVYKFDELAVSVQTKVIDRYRDRLSDLLGEDLEYIMNRELNNHADNLDFELAYSLNWCQGDGVSFTGSVNGKDDLFMLASLVYGNKIPKNILRLINYNIIYEVEFARCNYHYVHKYTVQTNIIENYNTVKDYCYISKAMAEFEAAIDKWRLKTCDILEKEGYEVIDNLYSDNNIKSYIIENDCEFFIDGRDYNC